MTQNLTSIADEYNINLSIENGKSHLSQNHGKPAITVDSSTKIGPSVERLTITKNDTEKGSFKLTGLPSEIILSITNNLSQFDAAITVDLSTKIGPSVERLTITKNDTEKGSFKLPELPSEIILSITNNLSQFDVLNLIKTCSKLYGQVLPQLYKHVIIDVNFETSNNQEYKTIGRTYINNYYKLKRFVKTYDDKSDSGSGKIKIYKFECLKLPEPMLNSDDHLMMEMILLFQKFYNLTSLIWLDKKFRVEYLYSLKNKELINTLILNITSDAIKKNKCSLYENYGKDDTIHQISNLNFPNLIDFQIKPFQNSKILLNIINNILINQNNPIEVCNRLKTLSFFGGDVASVMIPNKDIMECIFEKSKIQYLNSLTSLSMGNMRIHRDDAKYLKNSINLKNLKFLQLSGIEQLTFNENDANTINTFRSKFLTDIAPLLNNLTHLSINIDQVINTIPLFLEDFAQNNTTLKVLDLSTLSHPDLFSSISKFKNLKKLSLEASDSVNSPMCSYLNNEYFENFESLNLKSLRIHSNGFDLKGFKKFISSQKNLKYLDIMGAKYGDAPTLGLDVTHPTMYGNHFKVQQIALSNLKLNLNLKYIRINGSLFHCESNLTLNSIDGLNFWFKSKVRCLSLLDNG
ncbi:uncharacterized protein KGF55_000177 [Candida pseudojiufengensis]|uniref:uncharacterized protein n=1 Tax=Candida pseudojiufengensis TaxID=497109 RepID=UPI0022254F9C|nr:uncharacterized protein KGF55_000177 [Candida pseudojiufengensis]KAI5966768.1 hypothetical protein KGF55_000177 [Candida pseudojiufengensis]